MAEKMGRNDPCWCGSHLKYKKCHLGREKLPEAPISETLDTMTEKYGAEYCLYPNKNNCSGNIVRAHTIQRNGGLNKIAKVNQVYSFFGNNHADMEKSKGVLLPKLIGIKKASTFTGFCGKHDDSVFAPIEKYPFVASQEHSLLLGYRGICRELFTKQAVSDLAPYLRTLDRGRNIGFQRLLQNQLSQLSSGTEAGLRDIKQCKSEYDAALLSKDDSQAFYYVINFSDTPDIMCSGGQFPEIDFNGKSLQNLADLNAKLDHLTFSIIATENGGAAVFSWLGDSPASIQLVRSLHSQSDSEIPHSLVRYVFEFFENAFFSPDWWDSMADPAKLAIRRRLSTAIDISKTRHLSCLKDDGIRVVSWKVSSRETNLSL